mgnify:CR=1 FL=1
MCDKIVNGNVNALSRAITLIESNNYSDRAIANKILLNFKKSENNEKGNSFYHSNNGPLNISNLKSNHLLNEKFIEASFNCQLPINNDFNGETQTGVGKIQVFQKNGFIKLIIFVKIPYLLLFLYRLVWI